MTRLALLGALLVTPDALAEGFTPVEQLPSRPGLVDPLGDAFGPPVSTWEQWEARRPRVRTLMRQYVYGSEPALLPVSAKVEYEDTGFLAGKATLRDITLAIGGPDAPPVHLLLVLPNGKPKAGVFVGLNFAGNHAVTSHPRVRLNPNWQYPKRPGVVDGRATEAARGVEADVWNVPLIVERGYGLATVYNGDIDPDRPDARGGLQPLLRSKLARHHDTDFGTIAAWAWGLSRVADYLVTRPDVDAGRLAVVGHSRLGKTALLAGASDARFKVVIPSQSGCGGAAPSRGTVGESVKRINTAFPHWFNGVFKTFNDRTDRLPVDQHLLAALVAPRALLYANAQEDTWANPDGQLDALKAASPVWKLYDYEGVARGEKAASNQIVGGRAAFFLRPGEHSMGRVDWEAFLTFAEREFAR